jgi:hypothetical protein
VIKIKETAPPLPRRRTHHQLEDPAVTMATHSLPHCPNPLLHDGVVVIIIVMIVNEELVG